MRSLSARLLLSVSLLLLIFFGATIVVLEVAFREAGEQAQRDILDSQMMALLAAAEAVEGDNRLTIPPELPEPRFGTIGSGLYASLRNADDETVWRSRSALGLDLPLPRPATPGTSRFTRVSLGDGTPLMLLSLTVSWEFIDGALETFTFHVAESLDSLNAQIAAFRRQLFGWFAAVAASMLLAIGLAMRVILRPLRQVEEEIGAIEGGTRTSLSEDLPTELRGVARNMNLLIGSERGRAERYRQTLDNLAHSLKTPLAAMRAVLDEHPQVDADGRLHIQIERMNDIVRYQLRKPAKLIAEGIGLPPVAIRSELERLADGLGKVYRDKAPEIGITVSDRAEFRGDRGDFMEIAGNLLDNACKWCRHRVEVEVTAAAGDDGGAGLTLTVADDGSGVPEQAAERLLERGTRLDETAPGHGIGLAVVRDIAASYGGRVTVGNAALGGAEFRVTLFGRAA